VPIVASGPAPYVVADISDYLSGEWRLARVYLDRRRGLVGWFRGLARFAEIGDGMRYREQGRLRFGDFAGDVYREYRCDFPLPGLARISFADGRPFHDLDLSAGRWQAHHGCAADCYEGEFLALSASRWRSAWHVTGPRKDLVIRGGYRR
jgi:uncharacterized protein DUF6314